LAGVSDPEIFSFRVAPKSSTLTNMMLGYL